VVTEGEATRRAADLRLGRVFAWIAAGTSLLSMIGLLLVPPLAALIAQLTWSEEAKEACEASVTPCTPSAIPGYSLPAWMGVIWPAILLICLLVCWAPRRWWTPRDSSGRPKQPGVYSTPEWLRALAVVAAITEIAMTWGVGRSSLPAPDYLWPALLAVGVVLLASICIHVTAGSIPADTRLGLTTGYGFWLLPAERRRRSRLTSGNSAGTASPGAGERASSRRSARARRDGGPGA
jgi:hypothetical protein